MALGAPKTQKFQIGNAEVRIGSLSEVGKLTSAHSVGLVENVSVNFTQDTVDVEGGLPLTTYATAITKNGCTITADAKEFTATNLGVLLNKEQTVINLKESNFDTVLSAECAINAPALVLESPLASARLRLSSAPTTDLAASLVANSTDTVYIVDASKQVIATFVPGSNIQFTVGAVTYTPKLLSVSATVSLAGVVTALTLLTDQAIHVAVPTATLVKSVETGSSSSTKSADVTTDQVSTIQMYTSLVSFTVTPGFAAQLTKGSLVVTYPTDAPEKLSVVEVLDVNLVSGVVTLNPKTPLLNPAAAGNVIYKTNQIGLGGNPAMNYFTMDIISLDHDKARPQGFRIWKAAVTSGLDFKFSATDFGSTNMAFKAMAPLGDEYAAGGVLEAMANLANKHRYGFWFGA